MTAFKSSKNYQLVEKYVNNLAKRKIFRLANKLNEALQIAENEVMLYSEVLSAFKEIRSKEKLSKELLVEMDQLLESLTLSNSQSRS